jgi:uncharacterized protein YjbI with pentapeptide repeats
MSKDLATRQVRLAPWRAPGIALLFAILVMMILATFASPGGLGIYEQASTKVERDKNWRIIKYSIERNDGKTVWDWLGLIGVPMTLAVLGIWFQSQEQTRANRDAQEQRRLAAEENKEETLQRYFDRVSQLLIEKDLISLSRQTKNAIVESASNVIRARTLSVLRSFTQDGERRGSVVLFLIETEMLHKLKVSLANSQLAGANLTEADLSKVNIRGANLIGADLSDADLIDANLSGADLTGADLSGADLSGADLAGANLTGADLAGANLTRAYLRWANLSVANLTGAYLSRADLTGAKLNGSSLKGADLSGADLSRADLFGADISKAIFNETICPDGKTTDTGCPVPKGSQ